VLFISTMAVQRDRITMVMDSVGINGNEHKQPDEGGNERQWPFKEVEYL